MRALVRIRWDTKWSGPNGEDRFPQRCTIEWQRERMRLFLRYTLPSLVKQTYHPVDVWLLSDPANRSLHEQLGLEPFESPINPVWQFRHIYDSKRDAQDMADEAPVFLMRIDSDDILSLDAIALLVEHAHEGKPYVQLDTGVAWHEPSGTLYRWPNPSPPFYGRIVTAEELMDGLPGLGHHGKIRPECKVLKTEEPTFCVLLHGGNISNSTERRWCTDKIEGEEKARIMGRFGL